MARMLRGLHLLEGDAIADGLQLADELGGVALWIVGRRVQEVPGRVDVDPQVVIHRGHLHRPAAPEMEHRRDALGRGAKRARVRENPVHELGSKAA